MDRHIMENTVIRIVSCVLRHEVDSDCSRANTPSWDSLKHLEIIFAVEEETGACFSEQELAELNSVARIVELVLAKRAA